MCKLSVNTWGQYNFGSKLVNGWFNFHFPSGTSLPKKVLSQPLFSGTNQNISLLSIQFSFLNRCDSGYKGPTCIPEFPLSSSIQSDFEESGLLQSDWLAVHGGDIVHDGNAACGVITSGASLYFSQVKKNQIN